MAKDRDKPGTAGKLLAKLDESLAAAPLTGEKQLADVEQFRTEIIRLCEQGRDDDARRLARLCMTLIRQGAPAKE